MSIGDSNTSPAWAATNTTSGYVVGAYPCPACAPRCPCCGRVLTAPWYGFPYYGAPYYYGYGYCGIVPSGGTSSCSHNGVLK